ncbi:hypothetical protein [Streptomyces katrae]|uniref:hypothetical protein n=1 Tax=Streptomyces katrae TaxID=68223 RepID=UPI0004C03980|nr:hypothetical protein [Streptomyces katrae]
MRGTVTAWAKTPTDVANIARTKAEGTDRWTDLLKSTMPEGLVRDAILSSSAWPDIAAAMGELDARGIDVARFVLDAQDAPRPGALPWGG